MPIDPIDFQSGVRIIHFSQAVFFKSVGHLKLVYIMRVLQNDKTFVIWSRYGDTHG